MQRPASHTQGLYVMCEGLPVMCEGSAYLSCAMTATMIHVQLL